jgi:hypothetical protein
VNIAELSEEDFVRQFSEAKRSLATSKNFLSVNSDLKGVNENKSLVCSNVRDGEERDSIKGEKKFEVGESKLSDEEKRLFGVLGRSVRGAS